MPTDSPLDGARRSTVVPPIPALIRTPDQRVRVFVSSTLDELAPERAAARARLDAAAFEAGWTAGQSMTREQAIAEALQDA